MSRESLDGRRWIGRVLRDRWRIDARISRGGVGTVYAATHQNNGSRAAIKVLHAEFSRDVDTRSRFLQEGYAANQVNHPGVVRILDDDTSEDGHAYLVMELLEGELLETRRVRKGGRLPLSDVYEVGDQLLDVLAAAHEKGIVHRDIKPDNLFVTQEGRLKVLDFGFAQMRSKFRTEQTATGFLLGTPGFMSPEQAIGNRPQIDAQTDIWAAGATLFTLISGEPVHAGESAAEMLVAAANIAPRSLATVTSGVNPRLVQLVDRAVAFEKSARWPNARSMQMALRSVSGKQLGGQVSRRSIPDDVPTLYEDEGTEPTELAAAAEIEELDGADLVAHESEEAIPSAITRPVPRPASGSMHPADEDGPTLAGSSHTTDPSELAPDTQPPVTPPPRTPHMSQYPSLSRGAASDLGDPPDDGGTLIMDGPAQQQQQAQARPSFGSFGQGQQRDQAQPHSHRPQHSHSPQAHAHAGAQLFRSTDPRGMTPEPLPADRSGENPLAPAARTGHVPAAGGGSGVLVFIGVVLVTMVLVILAGLVILSASD